VVRPAWNTFTVPVGISDELANLIWFLVGLAVGVGLEAVVAVALGLAEGVAVALGVADGDGFVVADGDGFVVALFTGTGTPLPQTNLPLFLTQVNF
jgi:hypothetical protein